MSLERPKNIKPWLSLAGTVLFLAPTLAHAAGGMESFLEQLALRVLVLAVTVGAFSAISRSLFGNSRAAFISPLLIALGLFGYGYLLFYAGITLSGAFTLWVFFVAFIVIQLITYICTTYILRRLLRSNS